MKLKDSPFYKCSYGDSKTNRNILEVSAAALAAERLGIDFYIVDAVGHAFYLDVEKSQIKRIVTEVQHLSKKEVLKWMDDNF